MTLNTTSFDAEFKIAIPADEETTQLCSTKRNQLNAVLWRVELNIHHTVKERHERTISARISCSPTQTMDQQNFVVGASGTILNFLGNGSMAWSEKFDFSGNHATFVSSSHPCNYVYSATIEVKIRYVILPKRQLSRSTTSKWAALLESGDSADVVFAVAGEDIPAHSQILYAVSPVFAAMFTHDTQDRINRKVSIKDATAKAFREMLRCAYSNCDPEYVEEAFLLEVLTLADRYAVLDLKSRCVRILADTMTDENMGGRVTLALKENNSLALAFIISLLRKAVPGTTVKAILKEHPELEEFF